SRCVPQVMGAAWDAIEHVKHQLEIEFNSVNDNPVVFAERGEVVSAGLFHAQPVAMAADYLKIAVSAIANMSERRIDRLVHSRDANLPAVLATTPGLESGYMLAQYTAAALVSENKVLAHPASVDTIPTSGKQEDHVSMGWTAVRKLRDVVSNVRACLAVEICCAAQGIDLRADVAEPSVPRR